MCNNGTCGCTPGYTYCSTTSSCVDLQLDSNNCGTCGHACTAGQTCSGGNCISGGGQGGAGGQGGSAQGGGAQGGGAQGGSAQGGGGGAQGGSAQGGSLQGGSDAGPGMISDFEEGPAQDPPLVKELEGRHGCWERFYETDAASFTLNVEAAADSENPGSQYALHAVGTSAAGWGSWVGIGVNLNETGQCGSADTTNPQHYDASKYTGIRFRAKIGSGQDPKSAVRFNISIPETEGPSTPQGDYLCDNSGYGATDLMAARDCYQHLGRFLHVVPGYDKSPYQDNELSTSWKTFNYCFDSDLYPLSLPSNLTNPERNALASRILKIQFQFNQGKDWYVSSYPAEGEYTDLAKTLPFDFWLDDLEFFDGACPNSAVIDSGSSSKPFPQNANVGTCAVASGSAAMANELSHAYWRWTNNFVQGNQVVAVEQDGGTVTSESMGYGMLIAAAVGDKTAFDGFWGYVQTNMSGGLMTWKVGGSGSATDGDVDIAYALLMADAQWGGYQTAADSMISAIKSGDVSGDQLNPGNSWGDAFNPSYFAPSYFRTFGGMDSVITAGYSRINTNTSATTAGFPTDWTDWSGNPVQSPGQVTAGFPRPAYGYDAARVPWRVGLDGCLNGGSGSTLANTIVSFFSNKYASGTLIDLMKAGWMKDTGMPATASDAPGGPARDFQGSFIGPLGVGAMAADNATVRDRAFRTIMDILENDDFNHTYFPSTVGLITALIMSGNFPAP